MNGNVFAAIMVVYFFMQILGIWTFCYTIKNETWRGTSHYASAWFLLLSALLFVISLGIATNTAT